MTKETDRSPDVCAVLEDGLGCAPGSYKASGTEITDFTGGWAILCFVGRDSKAHYWRKMKLPVAGIIGSSGVIVPYESLCHANGVVTERAPAFHRGDFPRCKVCQRIADRWRLK